MTAATSIWHGLRDLATSMARARGALERQTARRAAIAECQRELSSYNNDDLAELGLLRSDIPRVAREAAGEYRAVAR